VKLVQGQALGGFHDLRLSGGVPLLLAWAGDEVDENDELAQADSQRFDDHGYCLLPMNEGAAAYLIFPGRKKTGDQRRFFRLQPVT